MYDEKIETLAAQAIEDMGPQTKPEFAGEMLGDEDIFTEQEIAEAEAQTARKQETIDLAEIELRENQ